jgi:hypothetical protein
MRGLDPRIHRRKSPARVMDFAGLSPAMTGAKQKRRPGLGGVLIRNV